MNASVSSSLREIKSEVGFTLVEVLMASFFGALLLGVLFLLYGWHSNIYNYETALIRVSGSARDSMQAIFSYTSQSHRVLASATINGADYVSNSGTLILRLPAVNSSGSVINNAWDSAVFYASSGKLYLETQPDPASSRSNVKKQLSDTLQSLSFTYNNPDFTQVTMVSINLQTQAAAKAQNVSGRLQQNAYLKNY